MILGDTVHIVRQKAEGKGQNDNDTIFWPRPTRGTVIYIGRRFLTVAMHSDVGRLLYRESFWPEQIKRIKP